MREHFTFYRRLILILSVVFLIGGIFASAPFHKQEDHLLAGYDDLYTRAVLSDLKNYHINPRNPQADSSIFSLLKKGSLIQAYDVQAYSAQKQGFDSYWYPHCLVTPIIAIDRDVTTSKISSWTDLVTAELPVTLLYDRLEKNLILGAISYGLEGENYSLKKAESLLSSLAKQNLLHSDDLSSPILICMDYQAVSMIKEGRNLELVVPSEGTLSYSMGLLSGSKLPLDPVDKKTLIAGGLRPDNLESYPFYPEQSSYENTALLTDYEHFLKTTRPVSSDLKKKVYKTNRFLPVNLRNRTLFVAFIIVLALFWMQYTITRSIRPDIKKAFYGIAFCVIGWMLIRICKNMISSYEVLNRILWYSFYIFQMGLPLLMLYISAVIDHPQKNYKLPKWLKAFLYPYPFFVLLVFTNDFHQLVFRFNANGNWSDEYTHRIGYFLIFAYLGIAFFLSIGMLIYKSRKATNWYHSLLSILLGILIIGYCIGYNMHIPLFRNSDFSVVMCLFSMIFCAAVLFTGLIPKNSGYTKLFESSPLNMQLLDQDGHSQLITASSTPLNENELATLTESPSAQFQKDEDTLMYGRKIHNGTAVWTHNISTLNQLNRQIETSNRYLTAANLLLYKTKDIRQKNYSIEIKNRIFSELEKETKTKIDELSKAIHSDAKLSYISLLLCYIKRRCNLFFIDKEQSMISGESLSSYLNELSEFASYFQIHSIVHTDLSILLELCEAILCYDFYFELLKWSYSNNQATTLGQLSVKKGTIRFHIMSSEALDSLHFSEDFMQALHLQEGSLTIKNLDETYGISLTFTRKEDEH